MADKTLADYVTLPHKVRVDTQSATGKDAAGGTVTDETTEAAKVSCLITQGSGRADTRFEQPQGVIRYTVTGADARLAQMDGVFTVLVGPPRVGAVLKVVAVSVHGPVPAHDIPQFFRATCEELIGG